MVNERKLRWEYLLGDFVMGNLAWLLLNVCRSFMIPFGHGQGSRKFLTSEHEILLQFLIPLFWMVIYYYSGYYNRPIHRDRLEEFRQTIISAAVGSLFVFFLVILNDNSIPYQTFYKLLLLSFSFQFILTYLFRFSLTQRLMRLIHQRKFGLNALIVGAGKRAFEFNKELDSLPMGVGSLVKGFVDTGREQKVVPDDKILGAWDDMDRVIRDNKIDEIIVAPDSHEEKPLFDLLKNLYKYNLPIKILAGKYSILSRAVKMTSVFTSPMIEITRDNMPEGQKNVKQSLDYFVAFVLIVLLAPLFLYLAWRIKKDSPGSVFYRQERIGYLGRPFYILKFRTMRQDAESGGVPQLSSDTDDRITPFGKVMRKYRLDELPQFINILRGEMSLVGPRPERKYFVDKIMKEAPYYCLIFNVKPGLTSWATVRNGYANTMKKMLDRLKYDIVYLESRSIAVDFKILFYTIKTVFTGEGM